MTESIAKILTPYDMFGLPLRNRLAVAPMTRVSATEAGCATSAMSKYYERFAQGEFGLVITEGIYTDEHYSQGYPFQPGIIDHAQAQAWRTVTDGIHSHQSLVFAQIMHAGALSQGNRFTNQSAAPSSVQPMGEQMSFYYGQGRYTVPKAMTDEEIADAIAGFANAAQRSMSVAGFDGIEIHGANGYLLDQFLTDYSNQRTDRWAGNTQQRIGLILEVIKAVRDAVGSAPVGVRISQGKVNNFGHKWEGGVADAETIFGSLQDAGVDFIHVTEQEAWKPAFEDDSASLVALARRYAPRPLLIANGGLHEADRAEAVLDQGADLIAIGKAALANPDFPARLAANQPLDALDASTLSPIANIKERELSL